MTQAESRVVKNVDPDEFYSYANIFYFSVIYFWGWVGQLLINDLIRIIISR